MEAVLVGYPGAVSYPVANEVPNVNDPRWETWTAPLAAFLLTPRNWEDLQVWRGERFIQENVLIQLVAWLSFNDFVHYDYVLKTWVADNWILSAKPKLDGRRPPKPELAGSNPAVDTFEEWRNGPYVKAKVRAARS